MEFGYFLILFGVILLLTGLWAKNQGLKLKPEYNTERERKDILHNKIGLITTLVGGPILIITGIILALYE